MSCKSNIAYPAALVSVSRPSSSEWPWPDWFRELAPAIARMWEKRLQRQQLLDLDDRLLRDIGITREQAEKEAAKRPWE